MRLMFMEFLNKKMNYLKIILASITAVVFVGYALRFLYIDKICSDSCVWLHGIFLLPRKQKRVGYCSWSFGSIVPATCQICFRQICMECGGCCYCCRFNCVSIC